MNERRKGGEVEKERLSGKEEDRVGEGKEGKGGNGNGRKRKAEALDLFISNFLKRLHGFSQIIINFPHWLINAGNKHTNIFCYFAHNFIKLKLMNNSSVSILKI